MTTTTLHRRPTSRDENRMNRFAPLFNRTDDPLGFEAGDANVYRYVGNSPTNMVDPSGLDGQKTVETGIKGIKFFIEWLPNRNTGEIKILTKKGAELAIAKWIVNPKTGETVCNVVATHGPKARVLPGVAQSTLKKIMPTLAAEMAKNVQRIGGTWVLTRLAGPAKTGGRLGLGRAAANTGRFTLGTIFTAITVFFSLENTCQAAEIEGPQRRDIDLSTLELTEQEILELSDALEGSLSADHQRWLDESYQKRLQRMQDATTMK
jgi:hypothetical protein